MPKSAKSRRGGESKTRDAGVKKSRQARGRKSGRIEERNDRRAGEEAPSESRLMTLPRELRNMIYNCLVSQPEDELLKNPQRRYRWFAIHLNFPFSILSVTRQIRTEFFEEILDKSPMAFRTFLTYGFWVGVDWKWPERETAVGKFAHGDRITVEFQELMGFTNEPAAKRDWDDWNRMMDLARCKDPGVREILPIISKMSGMRWLLNLACMTAPESRSWLP